MFERSAHADIGWTIADFGAELAQERYLGAFGDLPVAGGEPGEWCDVVVHDSLGEMRWTFVLVRGRSQCVSDRTEAEPRPLFPRAPRRRTTSRELREWEREDEVAAASSAPSCPRSAAATDGRSSGRRLRLRRMLDLA